MKNKVLLICLSLLISLGVSAQKYTIYIDDFNSEIKIPNKVLSTIGMLYWTVYNKRIV